MADITLPTSFEETIDFIYEVQNMADATEKAQVLWPVYEKLVKALREISDPLRLEADGIGVNRALAIIARMSSIAKDALVDVGSAQGSGK